MPNTQKNCAWPPCCYFILYKTTILSSLYLQLPATILIRSNKMQQYAGIYLLQNYSTCFGCPLHPSSGVQKTETAASGTDHSNSDTTFLQRGLIRFSVLLMMGAMDTQNMYSKSAVNKYLHTVTSCWILLT